MSTVSDRFGLRNRFIRPLKPAPGGPAVEADTGELSETERVGFEGSGAGAVIVIEGVVGVGTPLDGDVADPIT